MSVCVSSGDALFSRRQSASAQVLCSSSPRSWAEASPGPRAEWLCGYCSWLRVYVTVHDDRALRCVSDKGCLNVTDEIFLTNYEARTTRTGSSILKPLRYSLVL